MKLIIGGARALNVMPIVSKMNDNMVFQINRKSKIPLIFTAQKYVFISQPHSLYIFWSYEQTT